MADTKVSPKLIALYRRAQVCETFSAYRLNELTSLPAVEILQAMELLGVAREIAQSSG